MIVICTKCQAKFRVADEKIGPRGAKVRCSRCKEIFVVHRAPAEAPPEFARPPPLPPPPAAGSPRGADPEVRPSEDPFAAPPPVPPAPAPDPFAAAFAAPPVAAPPDPFGSDDPFAAAPPVADPFAAVAPPPAADPFAAPARGPGVRSTLPVTDLADVLGAAAALPVAAPAASPEPPPEDPFRAPLPPFPELEPPSVPFPRLDGAPFAAAPAGAAGAAPVPPDPSAASAERAPVEPPGAGDLALEDRLTPPPRPVAPMLPEPEPALDVGAIDPFAAAASPAPFDPGAFDGAALGGPGESLDVATPAASEPPAAPPPEPQVAVPAAPVPAQRATPRPTSHAGRSSRPRGSRVRTVAVNAVALAALLLVTLAIWVVWHAEGPLEAGSLRPSAILAALRREGPASAGPWAAHDVGSGLYERDRGAPLLFVRGRVHSRAAAPVPGVRVRVEVVRGPTVIASGEALAGAVPNPEELHGALDAAALARAVDAARARAPAEVRPGDSVPFLVALGDAPVELDGASIRLVLSPAGPPAPAPSAAPLGGAEEVPGRAPPPPVPAAEPLPAGMPPASPAPLQGATR